MRVSILNFIKKYPLTFISAIFFAALCTLMVNDLGIVYSSGNFNNTLTECLLLVSSIVSGSFLFSKIVAVYNNKIHDRIKTYKIIESLVAIVIVSILHFITRFLVKAYTNQDDNFAIYPLTIIFASLTYYLIIKETNISVPEYVLKVFMNILALFLFECIVASGIAVLFYIYNTLFRSADWQILLNILIFQFIVITSIGGFIAIENIKSTPSLFSRVLVKYVMMIMVLIGFVFFYIYLIKIMIKRELPSNQVFMVCTLLFSLGLSINLMAGSFNDNSPYDLVNKYLPLAFVPALVLQILSLFLRINQYGFTVSRYMGVILIIFEIIFILIYQFRYDKLKYIFLVDAVLVFIMSYVPMINMYQFPNIYNKTFSKDTIENMLSSDSELEVDGKGKDSDALFTIDIS